MNARTTDVHDQGLVCTHPRQSDHACRAEAAGPAVYEAVVTWLREREVLWSQVRVAETSCLGLCRADGAALSVQPRDEWDSDVRPADVPRLLGADATQLGR